MKCTPARLRLCTALLIAVLVFIWGNSLLPASVSQQFSDFVGHVLEELLPVGLEELPEGSESFLLRKLAHLTEFIALGALLAWNCAMRQKRTHWPLLWGAAAACIDETIQVFVPGRGPGLRDVAIDSLGVLLGIVLLHLGHRYLKKQ